MTKPTARSSTNEVIDQLRAQLAASESARAVAARTETLIRELLVDALPGSEHMDLKSAVVEIIRQRDDRPPISAEMAYWGQQCGWVSEAGDRVDLALVAHAGRYVP